MVDYTTPVGKTRLLAGDVDTTAGLLLTDQQMQALLDMEGGDERLAAAQALDIIASSEALISKKIQTQDLQTDGPATAKALRAQAVELRRQSDEGAGDAGGFDIIPYIPSQYQELTEDQL